MKNICVTLSKDRIHSCNDQHFSGWIEEYSKKYKWTSKGSDRGRENDREGKKGTWWETNIEREEQRRECKNLT